jgi:formaldehyde-activating enzyme involved in methanogenesis
MVVMVPRLAVKAVKVGELLLGVMETIHMVVVAAVADTTEEEVVVAHMEEEAVALVELVAVWEVTEETHVLPNVIRL